MEMIISGAGYVVPQELLNDPLYNDWSNKTMAQILAAKSDLQSAIGKIIPTQENIMIVQYLYNLLVISTALG